MERGAAPGPHPSPSTPNTRRAAAGGEGSSIDTIRKRFMADLQETLGKVIRQERQNRRLTIKELGEKAGLSEIYVGEIERGQKYPSAKVLESIANALDLDMADLLELMAEEIRYERHERQPHTTNA